MFLWFWFSVLDFTMNFVSDSHFLSHSPTRCVGFDIILLNGLACVWTVLIFVLQLLKS